MNVGKWNGTDAEKWTYIDYQTLYICFGCHNYILTVECSDKHTFMIGRYFKKFHIYPDELKISMLPVKKKMFLKLCQDM